MGSLKVTLCVGAAAAAAVLVPTAYASDEGGGNRANGRGSVTVAPSTPVPGADIALKVGGCGGKTATAVSAAFVADARLVATDGRGGTLVGETKVRSSITAGGYDVRITCVDYEVKGRIEIVESTEHHSQSSDPPELSESSESSHWYDEQPVAPASPTAPVHAGGGGTATLADGVAADPGESGASDDSFDEARVEGPGTAQAVTGLVLAGVAATVVAYRGYRGVRRGRGTG
ncbi:MULTISPECIES: hypothetical protein [Streptomyces]|uniref:Secreted protein n=2 Tax=Streptomyces TaxID=1883 RepID=A0ABV9IQS6_9ACTN